MEFKLKHKRKVLLPIAFVLAVLTTVFMLFVGTAPQNSNKLRAETTINEENLINGFQDLSLDTLDNTLSKDEETQEYLIKSVDDLRAVAYWVSTEFVEPVLPETGADEEYNSALATYQTNIQNQNAYTRASYRLENHLNLSGYNWTPIGTELNPFLGNFNGNGKSIYGLTIITSALDTQDDELTGDYSYYGLFGYVKYQIEDDVTYAPHIYSLGLKDTYIKTNGNYVGSLIGFAEGSFDIVPSFSTDNANASVLIEECYNTGYIEGADYVGGLVGSLSTGAAMYNCYNNSSSTYDTDSDIYTNIINGSAGGLVGIGVDDGEHIVISQSYNAATVSALDLNYAKLGGVMGEQSNVKSALYSRVVFSLASCLPSDMPFGYQDGVGRIFNSVSLINYNTLFRSCGFDIEQTIGNADWKGDAESVWLLASRSNGGLPVLYNVPQLIKLDFDAVVVDEETSTEQSILNENVIASFAQADEANVALVLNANSILVEQGRSIFVETSLVSGSSEEKAYQTYSEFAWKRTDYAKPYYTNPTTQELPLGQVFTYNDMLVTAYYEYRQYDIVFNTSPSDYLESIYVNGTPLQNNTFTTRYVDEDVEIQINTSAGYTVSSCSWLETLNMQNNTVALNIASCIDKGFSTVSSGEISQTIVLTPETYSVEISSNREDCTFNAYLGSEEFVSGNSIQYGQILSLEPETIAQNYKFKQWEYQIVENGESLDENAWTVLSTRGDLVTFQIPDCAENSTIYIRAVFTEQTWIVSLAPTTGGSVNLYNAEFPDVALNKNEFKFNENFIVKFVANTGYTLTSITINGQTYNIGENSSWLTWQNNDTLLVNGLTEDVTISGVFERNKYNVVVTLVNQDDLVSDLDGAQVVNASNESILGTITYNYKDQFTLSVILDEGYELISILENGSSRSNGSVYEVTGYTQIVVTVKLIDYQVNTNFNYTESTIYKVDTKNINGSGEYNYGDEVTISVSLPEMFNVAYWMVNGERVNNTNTTLTIDSITSNLNIVVYLQIKNITISFSASGDADYNNWFTITTSNNIITYNGQDTIITLKYGDFVNLSVSSQYFGNGERVGKYTFAYWKVNGAPVTTERYYSIYAGIQNLNIEAVFTPAEINILGNVAVVENNNISVFNDAGSIIGLNSNYYPYGTSITLTANANEGYKFAGWYILANGGNSTYQLVSTNAEYDLTVQEGVTVVAGFVKVAKVTLLTANNLAGTLQGAGTYTLGNAVTVNAVANDGYNFVRWLVDGVEVSNNPQYTFTITENTTLTAEFEQIYKISYASNDTNYGQVIGNTTGKYKENVTLEAISANNCTFVGWIIDDVLVSTASTLNITLNGDMEVQALFKKNFDWNILIILAGCVLFAVVLIAASSAYIKMREAEPMPVRALINGKDDKDAIMKYTKKKSIRDEIEPVPTRKYSKTNIQPVPVRKIVVAPSDHKGQEIKKKDKANNQKPTLKTDVDE